MARKTADLSWRHHRLFSAKWRLRNNCRNSILMTCHYPDLGSPSDWLNQISHAARPIRSTTQIWVVACHQYGISALVSQTSFGGETTSSPFISGICFLPLEPKKQKQITWSQVRETSRASPNVGFFLRPALVKLTAKKDGPSRILSWTVTYNENKDHLALNSWKTSSNGRRVFTSTQTS